MFLLVDVVSCDTHAGGAAAAIPGKVCRRVQVGQTVSLGPE
jgi:hypothetical protein